MDKDTKSLISKRKDIEHNEDLGNNYYPSGWQPQASFDETTKTGNITHVQPHNNNFKYESLLDSWGFDSKEFYIDEDTIRFSTWNAQQKGGTIVDMYAFPDLQVDSYYVAQNIRIVLKKISLTSLVNIIYNPI